jgi:hypothetical protein
MSQRFSRELDGRIAIIKYFNIVNYALGVYGSAPCRLSETAGRMQVHCMEVYSFHAFNPGWTRD